MAVSSGKKQGGIIELPNCIMESIVSLLPLKNAVDTIMASPPLWKTLSHSILTRTDLEFNYLSVLGSNFTPVGEKSPAFVRRVSKYLQQYQGNKIDSLKIDWCLTAAIHQVRLDEWIRFAIMEGVEELNVRLGCDYDDINVFPLLSLGGSSSTPSNLNRLVLERCILRLESPIEFIGFKRLTSLRLTEVLLDNCRIMRNILSVCLLLESLTFDRCRSMDGSFDLFVGGNRLTDLKMLQCESRFGSNVNISPPNLACLEFIAGFDCIFSCKQAPRLTRIYFSGTKQRVRMYSFYITAALVDFGTCPALESLHVQMPAEILPIYSLATYRNLKQLNLDIDLDRWQRKDKEDVAVGSVLDVIRAAPFLEQLQITTLNGQDLSKTNPKTERYYYAGFTNDHLRMVKMQGFTGNWYEMELAMYILQFSPQLEMLLIDQLGTVYLGDGIFSSSHWQHDYSEKLRGLVEGKLKGVKTDAQILFVELPSFNECSGGWFLLNEVD